LIAATIPMLLLADILGAAFNTTPAQAADPYATTINADADANPLHVNIDWQNSTDSGMDTTTSQLSGQTGDNI